MSPPLIAIVAAGPAPAGLLLNGFRSVETGLTDDAAKDLPPIPSAPDFRAFAEAGRTPTQRYQITGRTPLEWFIDRYRITQDRESGTVNHPDGRVRRSARSDRGDPPGGP